jgi:flagellar biosynthesis protein FliR
MTEPELLAALPGLAFALVLVLCRTGAAVMLLPGLGEAEPPAMLRAGLALALAALLLPAVAPAVPPTPPGLGGAAMVAAELFTGAALGWLARLPALALPMAGAVLSYMIGLSSVVQPDPALGGSASATARAMSLAVPVLILSSGLYALPLSALAGSYQLVPPGAMLPVGPAGEEFVAAVATAFGLALRLSAPFLLIGLVFQAGLGLLARLVPQLQVFSLAAPGQILGGLLLLGLLGAPMLAAWSETVRATWSLLPGH